jgi:hypothetical protein
MCEVCAIFGAGEHWSDFARLRNERFPFEDIQHYRDERKRRIEMINRILRVQSLSCTDWDGETLAIHHSSGRFVLAPTLNDVWSAVEKLSGRVLDPLNDEFFEGAMYHG